MPLTGTMACRRGVALRELIVIAALGFMLLLILIVWLGQTRGDASRSLCQHRQQQTAMAILQQEAVHEHFPGYKNLQAINAQGKPRPTGWVFELLPYLGYNAPKNEGNSRELKTAAADPLVERPYLWLFEAYGPNGNDQLRGSTPNARIVELICPENLTPSTEVTENLLSWVVNSGLPDATDFGSLPADWTANGVFENQFDEGAARPPPATVKSISEHDGLANTLLLSENVDAKAWTNTNEALVGFVWVAVVKDGQPTCAEQLLPINVQRGAGDGSICFARPSSFHTGGVNAVFANGKSQFINQDIDWLVYARLMTSNGQEAKLSGSEEPVPQDYR